MPDFSQAQRERLIEKGQAMASGGYPIRNRADLKRAIQAFGRAKNPEKTKTWILKRAKELDAMDLIPEKWLNDKEVEHMSTDVDNFLAHYGVPGMKWGKRKAANPEKYQKKADRAVKSASANYNQLKTEQGRSSKQTKAAKKELKVAKERAKAAPSLMGAVAGSLARKERYTNAEALQKRSQAGKLAAGGIITTIAANGLKVASVSLGENSPAARGAAVASTILGVTGGALSLGAIAKGADAAITERNSRQG